WGGGSSRPGFWGERGRPRAGDIGRRAPRSTKHRQHSACRRFKSASRRTMHVAQSAKRFWENDMHQNKKA
ncbi:hypothetical protein EN790_34490, partial [Mesorhizobium sp. M2D.F.Ca.ET.147.01.1.1]